MQLLSQTQYAAHRKEKGLDGVTVRAVFAAIKSKRISFTTPGRIDPEQADKDWAANTNPSAGMKHPPGTNTKKDFPKPGAAGGKEGYAQYRTKKEFYESELARLKVARITGELIPAEVVKKVLYECGRIIRAGHEDIVSQLAPDLAAETNIAAIEKVLKTRLDRLDSDLADRIEKLDETLLNASEEDQPDIHPS